MNDERTEMDRRQDKADGTSIEVHQSAGHTEHCARRIVWGDGECTCPGDGTGSPHHTMNPPPGGWPEIPMATDGVFAGKQFRLLRKHAGLTMGECGRALGLTSAQVSRIERGHAQHCGGGGPHPPGEPSWNPYNKVTQCHACGEIEEQR